MQSSSVFATADAEQFNYGITRVQSRDGRVVIITSEGDMTRHAIDEWYDVVHDTLVNWSNGTTVRLCLDLTHPNQGVTPYSMSRIPELYQLAEVKLDMKAKVAIVLRNWLVIRIFTAIFKHIRENHINVDEKIFHTRDEASAWLLE